MGDSAQKLEQLTEQVAAMSAQLSRMQSDLEGALVFAFGGQGYVSLSWAASSPFVPYKRKKLLSLLDSGRINGYREPGRGGGKHESAGEVFLELRSILDYCDSKAGKGREAQAWAKSKLKAAGR